MNRVGIGHKERRRGEDRGERERREKESELKRDTKSVKDCSMQGCIHLLV